MTARDPWHRVAFGAVAHASDREALEDAKQQLHDQLIADCAELGHERAGPVQWRWWPSHLAPRVLSEQDVDNPQGRSLLRFLHDNPNGLLVLATVEIAAKHDAEIDAEVGA